MARVVIIDDDEAIRSLLEEVLRHDGHETFTAANGKAGIKLVREKDPDLLITDIFMPEQEGVETIQEARAIAPDVPVIAISGGGRFQQYNLLKLAETLGAAAALQKPFSLAKIRETISEILETET